MVFTVYKGSFFEEFYYCFFGKKSNFSEEVIKKNLCKIFDMMDGSYRKLFPLMRECIEKIDIEKCCIFLSFIYDINIIINKEIYHGLTKLDLYKPFIILKKEGTKYYHMENEKSECILRYPIDNFLLKIYYDYLLKNHIYLEYEKKMKLLIKWDKEKIIEYAKKLEIVILKKGKKKKYIQKNKTELLNEIQNKLS